MLCEKATGTAGGKRLNKEYAQIKSHVQRSSKNEEHHHSDTDVKAKKSDKSLVEVSLFVMEPQNYATRSRQAKSETGKQIDDALSSSKGVAGICKAEAKEGMIIIEPHTPIFPEVVSWNMKFAHGKFLNDHFIVVR